MPSFQFPSINSILRLFRVSLIMIGLGMTMAVANVCPTGQTDCEMADMTESTQPADFCLIACGVLLPVEVVMAPPFSGNTSILPLPDAMIGISILPEPAYRPPRFLA
jgi:hypothetical protein